MRKELFTQVIITDALTGKHVCTIDADKWGASTIEMMINDIFNADFYDAQHGFVIKYGMKQ